MTMQVLTDEEAAAIVRNGDYLMQRYTDAACCKIARAIEFAVLAKLEDRLRDAERYRLLRLNREWSVTDGVGDCLSHESLDAAIDAARAAQQKGARNG